MKPLTNRQAEALCLVLFGMTNKEVSEELFISEMAAKHLIRRASQTLNYKGLSRFRTKFVSDFFLGKLDDDQCHLLLKNFRNRLVKTEQSHNPEEDLLPRGLMQ